MKHADSGEHPDNSDTFIITKTPPPDWIDQPTASIEMTTRTIDSWEPTPPDNSDVLRQ